jgi:hypothetical protein
MRIGLLDIDGHNFPNLALMKISAYHKSVGDSVEWVNHFNQYDAVYQSKVFTFSPDNVYHIHSNKIIRGGTGYDPLIKLDPKIERCHPDYSLYPKFESAYGFLTRGCPNHCTWCIVPKKEGEIRSESDIEEILQGRKTAILMDNNVLASDHGIRQIEKIIQMKVKVDFNQGLDARLIDRPMAKLLSQVKWLAPLRMSCDTDYMLRKVLLAMRYLREANCTPSRYFVYVMMQNPKEALRRIILLDKKGLDPFTQAYIDYSGAYNVTKEQERLMRWCNRKEIMRSCKFENYKV